MALRLKEWQGCQEWNDECLLSNSMRLVTAGCRDRRSCQHASVRAVLLLLADAARLLLISAFHRLPGLLDERDRPQRFTRSRFLLLQNSRERGTAIASQTHRQLHSNWTTLMATFSSKSQKPIRETTATRSVIGGLSADILDDAHEDTDLHTRVVDHLRHSRIPMFQRLQVEVQSGEVRVTGAVETAFDKQLLARSLKHISGVKSWRLDSVTILPPPVYREPWLRRLRELLPSRRTVAGIVAVSAASLLMILAPWAKGSHDIETVPISGQVFFEGQHAFGAFVTLHPIGGRPSLKEFRPAGYVQPNGQVKFSTVKAQDGVPPGEYLATVQWNKLIKNGEDASPGPNILPQRYLLPTTSGLKVKVEPGQTELPPLKLTR